MSEEAIEGFSLLLAQQNYRHATGRILGGISQFIHDCANKQISWHDTRPREVKTTDEAAAEFRLPPTWNTGAVKLALYAAPFPLTYTQEQAAIHRIRTFKEQQTLIQGIRLKRPRAHVIHKGVPLASAFLEAIGLGWLSPVDALPILSLSPQTEYSRRVRAQTRA